MNILLKSPDFLELNKDKKRRFLEDIKKKGYKDIPNIMRELNK
jgi:hypothetical protein